MCLSVSFTLEGFHACTGQKIPFSHLDHSPLVVPLGHPMNDFQIAHVASLSLGSHFLMKLRSNFVGLFLMWKIEDTGGVPPPSPPFSKLISCDSVHVFRTYLGCRVGGGTSPMLHSVGTQDIHVWDLFMTSIQSPRILHQPGRSQA